MKHSFTFLFFIINLNIFGQSNIYSILDFSCEYHKTEFDKQKLNGSIKNLRLLEIENANFHSYKNEIKLDSSIGSFIQYFLKDDIIQKMRMFNQDSSIFMKQIYKNCKIQEDLHFGKLEKLENQILFH